MLSKDNEVILVEDDPSVLRALCRLLKLSGFSVRTFTRPSALLETAIPASDVCLIFDVHLPEMNGAELSEKVAAMGCRCPLILITAYVDIATQNIVKRANAAAVLIKPFSRAALIAAITNGFASVKS